MEWPKLIKSELKMEILQQIAINSGNSEIAKIYKKQIHFPDTYDLPELTWDKQFIQT